jgi:hypothetical protein
MFAKVDTYKGKPILQLLRSEDDHYPFSFGVAKAKMVIESIEVIKAFVKKYDEVSSVPGGGING